MLFGPHPGRLYPHYQRQLEIEFGLEPYELEAVIDEWKNSVAPALLRNHPLARRA